MVRVNVDSVRTDSRTAWIPGIFFGNHLRKHNVRRSRALILQDLVSNSRIANKSHTTSCWPSLEKERSFCLHTARQVRNIYNKAESLKALQPHFQSFVKDDESPVTAIDVAIQGTLFKELSKAFSHDVLVAEEDMDGLIADTAILRAVEQLVDFKLENFGPDSSQRRSARWWTLDPIDGTKGLLSARWWTLDPIDGTKGLLSGGDFAVGLALQHSENLAGYPVLGSLILPRRGVLLLANVPSSKLEIIPLNHLDNIIAEATEAQCHESVTKPEEGVTSIRQHLSTKIWHFSGGKDFSLEGHSPWKPLCCGSLVKYAAVAQREAFALIQVLPFGLANSWDHAAGIAAVRASGGKVTDEYGNDFAVGCEEDIRLVQLCQGSEAIVASGRGVDHINLCSKVRQSLRCSLR